MDANNWVIDTEEIVSELENPDKSMRFHKVKNNIADKLHHVAEGINKKIENRDIQHGISRYKKKTSELLDHSADYVREFDYKKVDTGIRKFVKEKPARSLLIAGAVGTIIGTFMRRR